MGAQPISLNQIDSLKQEVKAELGDLSVKERFSRIQLMLAQDQDGKNTSLIRLVIYIIHALIYCQSEFHQQRNIGELYRMAKGLLDLACRGSHPGKLLLTRDLNGALTAAIQKHGRNMQALISLESMLIGSSNAKDQTLNSFTHFAIGDCFMKLGLYGRACHHFEKSIHIKGGEELAAVIWPKYLRSLRLSGRINDMQPLAKKFPQMKLNSRIQTEIHWEFQLASCATKNDYSDFYRAKNGVINQFGDDYAVEMFCVVFCQKENLATGLASPATLRRRGANFKNCGPIWSVVELLYQGIKVNELSTKTLEGLATLVQSPQRFQRYDQWLWATAAVARLFYLKGFAILAESFWLEYQTASRRGSDDQSSNVLQIDQKWAKAQKKSRKAA